MAEPSKIPVAELEAHGAAVDARLAEIMGPDEPEPEPEAAMDDLDEEVEEPDAPEPEPEPEESPVVHSKVDQLKAWAALERDGWTEEEIASFPEEVLMRRGLKLAASQAKNDEVYAERDRLRSKAGIPSALEPNEEQPGASDPAQGASHPTTAGVDLTSLAGPVAEKIAEMDDPKEVAQALASFVGQAVQQVVQQERQNAKLEQRAEKLLAGRFEGDISEVQAMALQLHQLGRHADKQGLDRFDALVEESARAIGGLSEVSQDNNTSPASPKRTARPPSGGATPPPKQRSEDELFAARLARIEAGEKDVSKLRAMR